METSPDQAVPGSFRDPSGHVFVRNGILLRQVNEAYRCQYDHLQASGLYQALTQRGLLVSHKEVPADRRAGVYKIIQPEVIPFISYPFEWCFSQLRDAALATLQTLVISLEHGMILKDASAYNVQFRDGKPILLDTLSFDPYREGEPWAAYGQFCRHFLAPLALMAYRDARLAQLLRINIDGISLDLASHLLPLRTWLSPALYLHLHLHARLQQSGRAEHHAASRGRQARVSRRGMIGLAESLMRQVSRLRCGLRGEWCAYYSDSTYNESALLHKEEVITGLLRTVRADLGREGMAWDLGANTGRFSRIAAEEGFSVLAVDGDHAVVEKNYRECRDAGVTRVLPLLIDLTNPTGRLGWAGEERQSLKDRGPADLVMALALLHHLAIGNNVPLDRIAQFLSGICTWLIIEFVPKDDVQVQRLLSSRPDIFLTYSRQGFAESFDAWFTTVRCVGLRDSPRTIYLLKRRDIP